MPILVNLRHLEKNSLLLRGEIPPSEMELAALDDLVHPTSPVFYTIEVQQLEQNLLAQGEIRLELECECARCLKKYPRTLRLSGWACHLPLEGEDKAEVVNDCVDLTPCLREDILLAFPQHPLCEAECRGLSKTAAGRAEENGQPGFGDSSSEWSALDQLKF